MEGPSTPGRARNTVDDPEGEAALGGADAVIDTPVTAYPGTAPVSPFKVVAPQEKPAGGNKLIWFAIVVAVGILGAYAAGMLQ